jgi:hypothetical protein
VPATSNQAALFTGAIIFSMAHLCSATTLDLSLKPGLIGPAKPATLHTETPAKRLQSGLGLALQNRLIKLAVDYNVHGLLSEQGTVKEDSMSQQVAASIRSALLNRILGLHTGVKLDSQVQSGGDKYQHRISPSVSRSLFDVARLEIKYQYLLNKASAQAVEKQQRGYTLGLNGVLHDGRLTWSGTYTAADTYTDQSLPTRSTEQLKLKSTYRFIPGLQLELSSDIKYQAVATAKGGDNNDFAQRRYGAGLTWSPSEHYSLAFKVKRQEQSRTGEQALLRSGSLSWLPRSDISISLNYGDQLVEGSPGVVFSTKLPLKL